MNIKISVDGRGLVFWLRTISYMQSMGNWKGELPSVEEKRLCPMVFDFPVKKRDVWCN